MTVDCPPMVVRRSLRGGGAGPPPAPELLPPCPLCGRPMVRGPSVDAHHLVPKSRGGRTAEPVHRVCHRKLHATFTETQLACEYSTWAALRTHPEIAAFVRWLRNKPPEFYDGSVKTRRMRGR